MATPVSDLTVVLTPYPEFTTGVASALNEWLGRDARRLMTAMIADGGVVAGSFVTAAIAECTGRPRFVPSDIDIWVPKDATATLDYLTKKTDTARRTKRAYSTSARAPRWEFEEFILNGHKIQVISSNDGISNFDLTCSCCTYDGVCVYAHAPFVESWQLAYTPMCALRERIAESPQLEARLEEWFGCHARGFVLAKTAVRAWPSLRAPRSATAHTGGHAEDGSNSEIEAAVRRTRLRCLKYLRYGVLRCDSGKSRAVA